MLCKKLEQISNKKKQVIIQQVRADEVNLIGQLPVKQANKSFGDDSQHVKIGPHVDSVDSC